MYDMRISSNTAWLLRPSFGTVETDGVRMRRLLYIIAFKSRKYSKEKQILYLIKESDLNKCHMQILKGLSHWRKLWHSISQITCCQNCSKLYERSDATSKQKWLRQLSRTSGGFSIWRFTRWYAFFHLNRFAKAQGGQLSISLSSTRLSTWIHFAFVSVVIETNNSECESVETFKLTDCYHGKSNMTWRSA